MGLLVDPPRRTHVALHSRRRLVRALGSLAAAGLFAGCELPGDDGSAETTTADGEPATTAGDDGTAGSDAPPPDGPDADVASLTARAREFVGLLDAGSYEEAAGRFSPLVADRVSAGDLGTAWEQLESRHGAFVAATDPEYGTNQGYDQITLSLRFQRGRERFVVTFGEDGLLGFQPAQAGRVEWTPPAYADSDSFETRGLEISATAECALPAELTLPAGESSVPGVVLVHGTGPNDMDETVGPNKPFKDVAWGLSSRGVAVLRYDKRTVACDVDLADATVDDVVTEDALAALSALREQDRVDEVVLAGHSIGGTLAPRIARRDGELAGVVMLAALARPVPDAILAQTEYLLTLDGELSNREASRLAEVERAVERIRALDVGDDEVLFLGGREYWETLQSVDAPVEVAALDVPRLLLQGERDYQVTVEEDLALLRSAVGDDPAVTVRTYPALDHLFLPGEGPSTPQQYAEPGNVDRAVIEDVATWIGEITRSDG